MLDVLQCVWRRLDGFQCRLSCQTHVLVRSDRDLHSLLAKDKGGPSKGGFLNTILFSYMDLYSCNEINGGMCIYIYIYNICYS